MSELIVYKSNDLVVSRYDLTEQETKLILYGVARLNPKKNNPSKEDRTVIIPYDEYAKMMKITVDSAWHNLNNAVSDLMSRTIEIVNPDPKVAVEKRIFQWVNSAEFNRNTQSVELVFSNEIQPFLFNLKEFIKYKLENVKSLNNKYSMRLYEIFLKALGESKCNKKDVVITIDEFKSLLVLESSYPSFKELNRRILKVTVDDINKNSDLTVSLQTQGRPVNTLIFTVEKTGQLDLVSEIEKYSVVTDKTKSRQPRKSQKQKTDENRFKGICVILEDSENGLISISKADLNLIKSMQKRYESDLSFDNATDKQKTYMDGLIAKYRPKI